MNQLAAKTFQDLIVWQKAHQFVLAVYNYSDYFPEKEVYGLTSQFRQAAVSVAGNIAEGFRKKRSNEKARFVNAAQSSLEKCRYYLILARDLGYGDHPELLTLLEEIGELLEKYSEAILAAGS